MADLRLVYSAVRGQFADAMQKYYYLPIAEAATGAIKDAANYAKINGRQRIAAAGFSKRWQNALRANVYPTRGVSAHPAAFIYHKIPYAGVFETGYQISGSPMLWIPFSNVPARIGGRKISPRVFAETIGPLKSVNRPGHPPMLVAYIAVGSDARVLTSAKLRAGARRLSQRGLSAVKPVPIFYGINTVTLKAKFGLQGVFERARSLLGYFYANNSKAS